MALEAAGIQNKLIDFLFVGGDIGWGSVEEFIQVVTALKASVDVFTQARHPDKVEHDKSLGKDSVYK